MPLLLTQNITKLSMTLELLKMSMLINQLHQQMVSHNYLLLTLINLIKGWLIPKWSLKVRICMDKTTTGLITWETLWRSHNQETSSHLKAHHPTCPACLLPSRIQNSNKWLEFSNMIKTLGCMRELDLILTKKVVQSLYLTLIGNWRNLVTTTMVSISQGTSIHHVQMTKIGFTGT